MRTHPPADPGRRRPSPGAAPRAARRGRSARPPSTRRRHARPRPRRHRRGASSGAKPTNSAWSRSRHGRSLFLSTPVSRSAREIRRTWEVPVLPPMANSFSLMRERKAVPPFRVVNHLVHRLNDQAAGAFLQADFFEGARRFVRGVDARRGKRDARRHREAAIHDAGRHHGQLQRRRQHISLADARDQRFAELPRHADGRLFPGLGRHQAVALAGNVDPERGTKTETPGHLGDAVDADALRQFVEMNVAGFLDRLDHVDRPVPALLPAMELLIAELDMPVAGAAEGRRDIRFERGQRDDDLEGGAGRVLAGERLVGERIVRVGD